MGVTDDPHLIDWFREHGYIVEDDAAAGSANDKPLDRMNKAELAARAAELGITVPAEATKAQLLALVEAKLTADTETADAPKQSEVRAQ